MDKTSTLPFYTISKKDQPTSLVHHLSDECYRT